ncbi:MAG: hypothetical protein DME32_09100 [Verrucomicrobia bacterium]|nr:MAG: hypothetical protein DME32_09100 [Verrucomicrobiota bacterium]
MKIHLNQIPAEGLHLTGEEDCALGDLGSQEVRCVGPKIKVPAFALHTELHGPETVDITPFMREDILLNLPPYPHCDRDGGRVCKGAKVETHAEDQKGKADWSALDKLKLNR